MTPLVGSSSCDIILPSVDLPQPDSPIRPSVSPGNTRRFTRSTARKTAFRPKPRAIGNCFERLTASSSGVAVRIGCIIIVLERRILHHYPAAGYLPDIDR
jgi:hypothetical protein